MKKSGLSFPDSPECANFFKMINDAYKSFDNDFSHIEHILEESSKELFVANQNLIHERDHTKTKLVNIVDHIGGVIFETDLNGNFTYLNNAWTKYTGIPTEATIGKSFKEFFKDVKLECDECYHQLFSNLNEHIEFLFKYHKHEQTIWFEVKAKLIKNELGESLGFIGTIMDVSHLKETELQLQKASKAKDEFLSTMSHEIRTPLNAVTGLTNILLMEDFLPEQLENLKALKYSGEHLLGLINDLLDIDKINSGKLKLVEKDFGLNLFLENINSHFVIRAQKKGIVFNVVKENDIPNNIIGDKLKLAQIIKNLLSNSLKFTESGSIILKIKNLGIKENKATLEFKVIDTGIGISKNNQELIFESFMQASNETSTLYGGTGLGLAICKKLLILQGSDLKVTSDIGKGAVFSFEITYKVSNRLDLYEPDMIKMQPDYLPLNLKVLIAEDNKMNVLILKRFFLKWHVDYEIAENGKEVLNIINRDDSDFNLILMDLQMPILDGYETTKAIRNLPDKTKANIPIIALTAFAQTDIKEKTKLHKMDGFMGKPFNPLKLYKLLKKYSSENVIKKAL